MPAPATATHHARGLALMLLSTLFFTTNVLLVRALAEIESADIWLISSTRFVVGLAMIATIYRRDWQPRHLLRSRKLAERGLLGGFGVYITYLAVVKAGAGRATFINNTYVVWGALLAAWLLREKLSRAVIVGSAIALIGLGLLTNIFSALANVSIYDGVAVLSAWLSGYVVVTIRQLHATEHSSTIFAAQCAFGLLICVIPATFHPGAISSLGWMMMVLAGIFAAGGQLAMTHAFRTLPVAEGSLLQMIVPLGTALGGFAFFGERFTPRELIGAALILGGTIFTALRR